jgi:hypothetical protein
VHHLVVDVQAADCHHHRRSGGQQGPRFTTQQISVAQEEDGFARSVMLGKTRWSETL